MELNSLQKPVIIISGINLRTGGPLTIIQDCLKFLSESVISEKFRIIALVHKRELFTYENIEYIEFPDSIKFWIKRLYYEYFYFKKLSKKYNPYLWLSLHDITPSVNAERQAVYMHNPSISNKFKFRDLRFDLTYVAFTFFYKFLYLKNIKKNIYCIVQQGWFRELCSEKFGIPEENIIVARPNTEQYNYLRDPKRTPCRIFFFPALPRPFKNFEVICDAASILYYRGVRDITFRLTIDGSESKYSHSIVSKYMSIPTIEFCGLIPKEKITEAYNEADCLIFPSRLETWGLPISEFIPQNKPMLLSDLPYAHETAQGGELVAFFNPSDAMQLANLVESAVKGDFMNFKNVPITDLKPPTAASYKDLFNILLN